MPGILTTRFGVPITKEEYGHLQVQEISDLVREKIEDLIKAWGVLWKNQIQ